jgi:peptidoglycan/LPS O-acetylase OafA/YrhL
VGPLVSNDPSYFYRTEAWHYLLNILIFKLHPYLPGVFVGQAVENVNGSLWTLPVEVLCYTMLIVLAWAGAVNARFVALLMILMLAMHLNDTFVRDRTFLTVPQLFLNELGYLFFSGSFLALVKERLPVGWTFTAAAATVIAGGYFLRGSDWHPVAFVYLLLWPYTIISSALLLKKMAFMNRFDISYGVYIYGFVIQQCLAFFVPSLKDPILFAILSIIFSCCVGFASWEFVEKPCINLKKRKYLSGRLVF